MSPPEDDGKGLGQVQTLKSNKRVSTKIRPTGKFYPLFDVGAVIVKSISGPLPHVPIDIKSWSDISNCFLADPTFNQPSPVDCLIGASLFPLILENGRLLGNPSKPVAINTAFGFVLMGKTRNISLLSTSQTFLRCEPPLDRIVQKFWEVEEVPHVKSLSSEDELCESIFAKTTYRRDTSGCLHVRYGQYLLLFLAQFLGYSLRAVLTVAVISMTSNKSPNENIPTYPEWKEYKNLMLSTFFMGYICSQICAGQLAKNYGPKNFLGAALFICSVFSILIPAMGAKFGYEGVIACRVIQGLMQGFLFPSIHNLLGEWAPLADRAKVGTFIYTGTILGTAVTMPIVGLISASQVGWPVGFYVYGAIGILWTVAWFAFGSNSPSQHKSISEAEKKYIEFGLLSSKDKKNMPTPWKEILTSLPFYAILVSQAGQNFGMWTLMTEIPAYMQNILHYDIAANSTLSALPYLVLWLLSLIMSPIADYIVTHNITSVGTSRKIFNSIGFFIPALALFSLTFVGNTQRAETVFILVIAVGFNAATYSGFNVNHIDLSPNHSGTLMGIANTISNIFSILAPLAVDLMSEISGYKETDKELWNIVFNVAAIVYVGVATFFIFFATGRVQPWNGTIERKS